MTERHAHKSAEANLDVNNTSEESSTAAKFVNELHSISPSDLRKAQATDQPLTPVQQPTEEDLKRFFQDLFRGGEQGQEVEEKSSPAKPENLAPNPGVEAFEKTYNELETENLKALQEKQPGFREAIKLADKHLVDTANNYVLDGYNNGRFEKITELSDKMAEDVDDINEGVKKIPLHQDQVKAVEMINKYLHSDTDRKDKPEILAQLKKIGFGGEALGDKVEALDKNQTDLKPLYIEEQTERARVFLAYKDAATVRQNYGSMLQTAIQSPNTPMEQAKKHAEEFRGMDASGQELENSFGQYATEPRISKDLHIQFEAPPPPRTWNA